MTPDQVSGAAGSEGEAVFRPGLLDGQVVIVTGGGSGIGLGIAELLGHLGAHVVLASRKAERLAAAATHLGSAGIAASTTAVDVRDPEAVRAMVDQVAQRHGRLDALVNNAAGNFYAPSATLSANGWRAVLEIDLFGTFYCSQAVAPIMRERGGGRIVNISMTLHYRGWPQMAHATAAKAGVDALTRTLAMEWAPWKIRVNAVAPGPVPTDGVRKAFSAPRAGPPDAASAGADAGGTGQRGVRGAAAAAGTDAAAAPVDLFAQERALAAYAARAIPLGRWGTPRDVANGVAFLLSPAGDWITGAIFVIDGGEWLQRPTS